MIMALGHIALQNCFRMINGPPKLMPLAVDFLQLLHPNV
jgi:hypothetical protein